MLDPLYESNAQLNNEISSQEVSMVVMAAKNKSSADIDSIPYVVLKFENVIAILSELFQIIFDSTIVPSLWRKAIIFPILKDLRLTSVCS